MTSPEIVTIIVGMRTRLMAAMVLWVIIAVGAAGCVEPADSGDGDRARPLSASGRAESVSERHDVAVTAVDTDPQWIAKVAFSGGRVALLAVVENKGNTKEKDIVVEACLYSRGKKALLLHGVTTVEELSPGQSEVVRFGPFSSPPASSSYVLEVDARPVPHEESLANNFRLFHIVAP
ncbi:MAG: hypothetical protein ABIH46_08890 [Chloroflexota bacterium]